LPSWPVFKTSEAVEGFSIRQARRVAQIKDLAAAGRIHVGKLWV